MKDIGRSRADDSRHLPSVPGTTVGLWPAAGASTPPLQGQSHTISLCPDEGALPKEPAVVRRYEEPIEVRQGPAGADGAVAVEGGPSGAAVAAGTTATAVTTVLGGPEAFLWRGRLYVVRAVLDRWQERRPWWREAREQGSSNVLTDARERQVWRVEASAGRCAAVGVYDLGADRHDLDLTWRLLRVAD